MVSLSIVIPATDRPDTLGACLDAIHASDGVPDEIIVVDQPAGLSPAEARNVGARRAGGDVVVFVDADVAVHPDAFARIRRAYRLRRDLTAVFGAYDDRPPVRGTVSAFRNLLHHHVHTTNPGRADTFWAGLGAVRRSEFLAIGGFDGTRYRVPSIEDIELGSRLIAAGAEIVLDPAIQGTHLKRWTLRSMLWTDFARRGVPWTALEVRSRRLSSSLNLGWRHRVSLATTVVGVGAAVTGHRRTAVASLGLLVFVNRSFYALLARRQGLVRAGIGVLLHISHHLVAAGAIPVGLTSELRASWLRRRAGARPERNRHAA